MDRQLTIDWFRGALDCVPLPATDSVSSETLRAVLIAVYAIPAQHGGRSGEPCWAGQTAIAAWATEWLRSRGLRGRTVSERTARRALRVLETSLHLLTSYRATRPDVRTRRTLDHYVILWTEVGSAIDRDRGVTRPAPTREPPATRPGLENERSSDQQQEAWPVDRPAWPVDRPAWPVDRPAWPVDRPAWPVDRRTDNISARAEYGLGNSNLESSTATLVRSDPDGRADADRTDWAAVAAVLRRAGVGTARQRADELRRGGATAAAALAECERLLRVAAAHASRFRAGLGAAVAYRLRTGDWPCEGVDEAVEAVAAAEARCETQESERRAKDWARELTRAYHQVRQRTPVGQAVDDRQIVRLAVSRGVPAAWAFRERGLEVET